MTHYHFKLWKLVSLSLFLSFNITIPLSPLYNTQAHCGAWGRGKERPQHRGGWEDEKEEHETFHRYPSRLLFLHLFRFGARREMRIIIFIPRRYLFTSIAIFTVSWIKCKLDESKREEERRERASESEGSFIRFSRPEIPT
jgi:hypothetical protein